MARVAFVVGIAVRGPIAPRAYQIGSKRVSVSYPEQFILRGAPQTAPLVFPLPSGRSTQFVVEWDDDGRCVAALQSSGFERHLVVYEALGAISELLLAFKLVCIGHADGRGVRTIGIGDTLYFYSTVDGGQVAELNMSLWQPAEAAQETTSLALPHVGTSTIPLARRYVRCFELVEHGFYTEAFLVAFALLDDFVNQTVSALLEKKGLESKSDRAALMRGIKENRLAIYLGPLLKVVAGTDIQSLWSGATSALNWFNSTRNRVAHAAESVERPAATWAIFASLKVVICLRDAGFASADIPVEIFREAKVLASWALDPPSWVPDQAVAELMDFTT
ncbi:hypothetical protein J2X20_002295 [Pelomonas saccharophila]|uniref:Apea-like HEPN domain-containing protein n=1 Tax=Roseateles saccharophilus TaxID=304 RepID=A0ABU1YNV5_ROSSA|nr:hypothetical protein [Roseateles saccharophilus]MDR7269666.1 hypothetical protein [Roseateles saccharophilus]